LHSFPNAFACVGRGDCGFLIALGMGRVLVERVELFCLQRKRGKRAYQEINKEFERTLMDMRVG